MPRMKKKKGTSDFDVFTSVNKLRKDITDLLLRDFGYSIKKSDKNIQKMFSGKPYEELNESQKLRYESIQKRNQAFENWYIESERNTIIACLREITKEVYMANSIYPTCIEEYKERRIHQDRSIGHCFRLVVELQDAISTLPVDINAYTRFSEQIQEVINLLKGWRKSDNRFLRVFSETSSNFANVNGNGNANCNNASNAGGVRPDFDATIKKVDSVS